MSDIFGIARSGMAAAQARLTASASNIANRESTGFRRFEVESREQMGGGVSAELRRASEVQQGDGLTTDLVNSLEAKQSFAANLKMLKTQDSLLGNLLDIRA
ncbi:flagellar basal body rod C-terminal domain-containing protein [Aquimonas sp.]|jgi:flagellar basal body rod protein FlgC|uniref:flagellar basal body rod C-terminal domain-containing protein n=1 Tax=Aquimonas sp. TaxID=1872588 RepID=UPI0037BF261D